MQSFFSFSKKMIDQNTHINLQEIPESPVSLLMRGMVGVMREKDAELYHMQQKCSRLESEAEAMAIAPISVVAEGKQKKLIAILNAIFESGYITNCSKKEYMQRMATALGCPGISDYNKALYNVKNTYQYEEIFTDLAQVAHNEILKNG